MDRSRPGRDGYGPVGDPSEALVAVAVDTRSAPLLLEVVGERGRLHDTVTVAVGRQVALLRSAGPAAALAHDLRGAGWSALARPVGGAAFEAWWRNTAPVPVAGRLTVVGACSEHERFDAPGLVELGPGGFGNGHHATTALLLEVLVDHVTGGERVLDVGSGSGVLGLAALRLGAATLTATDRKPEARAATRSNAAINGLADRVRVVDERPCRLSDSFDVVVANIARDGIATEARGLVARTARMLAVSGITPGQVESVSEMLAPLEVVEVRRSGDWAAVLARHRG